MKHLSMIVPGIILCLFISTSCLSPFQRPDKTQAPAQVFIYDQNLADLGIKVEKTIESRKEPVIIEFSVEKIKDKETGQEKWIFNMGAMETHGFKRGEKVIWRCKGNVPFTVHLGWDSPFIGGFYTAHPINNNQAYETDPAEVRWLIPLQPKTVRFQYFIAAYIRAEDKVITFDSSSIIVPPPDYDYYHSYSNYDFR